MPRAGDLLGVVDAGGQLLYSRALKERKGKKKSIRQIRYILINALYVSNIHLRKMTWAALLFPTMSGEGKFDRLHCFVSQFIAAPADVSRSGFDLLSFGVYSLMGLE